MLTTSTTPTPCPWDSKTLNAIGDARYAFGCKKLFLARGRIVTCRKWTCTACVHYRRYPWAKHARSIFQGKHGVITELFSWRGPKAQFTCDCRQRVHAGGGQYISVDTAHENVLAVTTVAVTGSVPITCEDADREVLAAIAACSAPLISTSARFHPVAASKNWQLKYAGLKA